MGWTGIFTDTKQSNKNIILQEFTRDKTWPHEILKASQKGSKVWLLVHNKTTDQNWACLVLCARRNDGMFVYKEIPLNMGPYEYDMPSTWIKKLSKDYLEEPYVQTWLQGRQLWLKSKEKST